MDEVQKLTAQIAAQIYTSGNHIVEEAVAAAQKIVNATGGLSAQERIANIRQDNVFLLRKVERLELLTGRQRAEIERWREVTGCENSYKYQGEKNGK